MEQFCNIVVSINKQNRNLSFFLLVTNQYNLSICTTSKFFENIVITLRH